MFTYTAFEDFQVLAHGVLEDVALSVRKRLKQDPNKTVLIFSDSSGKQMDLNLSGTEKETLERLKVYQTPEALSATGPGRPKLGVISREISLLPQHWEWLSTQTGGSSGTIRRLIEEKIKAPRSEKDKLKQTQEAAYRFLSAIAGDLPNFEEAIRFMYRKDKKKFKSLISGWPKDLVNHTLELTESIFTSETN